MADGLTDLPEGIALRPTVAADRAFLLALYGTTRADELSAVPWAEHEKATFVAMQFDAQDASYRQAFPDGRFLLVLAGDDPIGRLSLARLTDELRIVDIILVPERCGQGIGSVLLAWVLAETDRDGLAATLHVEPWNPAKRLYERLGFQTVEAHGFHEFMRRPARRQLKTAS